MKKKPPSVRSAGGQMTAVRSGHQMTNVYTSVDQVNTATQPPMRFRPVTDEDRKKFNGTREEVGTVYFIDRATIERFLSALERGGQFTFQSFDDSKERKKERAKTKEGDPLACVRHGSLDQWWDRLCRLNVEGAGIYVTVNKTDLQGRTAKNVTRVRALFIDLDGTPVPEAFHVQPHIRVESSPGKQQAHWLVKDCPLDQFEALQKRLAAFYGSDPSVCDLPRVMRIPGFFHRKGEPYRSRLLETNEHEAFTIDEVMDGIPRIKEEPKPEPNPEPEPDVDDPFRGLNSHALANLDAWVPQLFPGARRFSKGWRVSSASLGRNLEEDISFTPQGIKDFGVHDMDDPNEGRRTPIAIVMEWKQCDESAAIRWLCERLGIPVDDGPAFSEEAIAIDFAKRNADNLRHVAKWGQWFVWDGACWREDEKRGVFTIARNVCRETAIKCNKLGERKRIASAKTRAAVVSLAGEDPRMAATIDQWDTDPWLLNTPEGVVDLRTGHMREHRPEDYMTKRTSVSPGGECPRWWQFIVEVTGGDQQLAHYLQRIAGYCLTGVTDEQQLFFLYGTGCNGKGVFINTLAGILGDYHRATSIETFTVSHNERHPTELAGLRGARLVTAAETEDGRRWAEARIKELTGGDKVTARFMRQDFFEFTPQFKLVFSGNHMPVLRSVNKAITRRFRRIPFTVTIPDARVNIHLTEELRAEAAGILAWLIEGCLAWQCGGLKPPAAVLAATDQYLESQDVLGDWLSEDCEESSTGWEPRARLYEVWSKWAEERGEYAGGSRWFSQKLEDRGFVPRKGAKGVRGFGGLKLKPHTNFTNPEQRALASDERAPREKLGPEAEGWPTIPLGNGVPRE
jgi:putative DNA primase/helicase